MLIGFILIQLNIVMIIKLNKRIHNVLLIKIKEVLWIQFKTHKITIIKKQKINYLENKKLLKSIHI